MVGCSVDWLGSSGCIGVLTTPGATALKRIPSFAYSVARFMVAEFRPPFVIIEFEPFVPAIGRSASAAVILTTHPDFCLSISFTALSHVEKSKQIRGYQRVEVFASKVSERLG